jgi:C4-dicarboxylate transporter/malic acid transport protein
MRWIRHPSLAVADLRHPIKGGMSATAAGSLLTLAVALGRVGGPFLPAGLVEVSVAALTVLGAVLALVIGWEFLVAAFTSQGTELAQVSGAWFVPPVVTIIVPLALLPLIDARPGIALDLLIVAWGFLGIGAVLYLTVIAALFLRSVGHPLPPAALAPTLFIGMGPAGLIALDLVRLAQVSELVGVADEALLSVLLPVATMMWGFGLWWMASALLVLGRGYATLPFALSWWGFTFPLAAWTIGTIALARSWGSGMLTALAWLAVAALTALWGYVAARTIVGLRTGTIWSH